MKNLIFKNYTLILGAISIVLGLVSYKISRLYIDGDVDDEYFTFASSFTFYFTCAAGYFINYIFSATIASSIATALANEALANEIELVYLISFSILSFIIKKSINKAFKDVAGTGMNFWD